MKNRLALAITATLLAIGCAQAQNSESQVSADGAGVASSAAVSPRATVDAGALARAQAKLASAQAIAEHFALEANTNHLGDAWRIDLVNHLMLADSQGFAEAAAALTLADARGAAYNGAARKSTAGDATDRHGLGTSAVQPKSLGTAASDLVYVPLTPCRILDTRAGSPVATGGTITVNYAAVNTGSGSCGVSSNIPGGAFVPAAEAVNVTVVQGGAAIPTGSAFLSVYPQGGSNSTSFMNYVQGDVKANAGVISINQSTGNFIIYAQFATNVLVDVFGVFVPPQATALDCVDVTGTTTSIGAGAGAAASAPSCTAGYSLVAVSCIGNSFNLSLVTSRSDNGICTWLNNGSANTAHADAHCCRVPGR